MKTKTMKKYILPLLFLASTWMQAQNYIVTSLATPGAATFTSDKIDNGVITLPFTATTQTIPIETNQQDATVSSDAEWCQAFFADKTLTLTVTENTSQDARTAILSVRSKDFHPLLVTVKQEARLVFAVISDVHVGNTARALGMIDRKANDKKTVLELTAMLRQFRPDDPVIYDYALFGIGVTNAMPKS